MVSQVSTQLVLAAKAGPELPSVDDFLPDPILFQGTPFAINRIILIRIVATIVLLLVMERPSKLSCVELAALRVTVSLLKDWDSSPSVIFLEEAISSVTAVFLPERTITSSSPL